MVVQLKISIILLTKNGERFISQVLSGIFSQSGSFEVIAVDSGSTDGTLEILKSFPVSLFQIPPGEFNHGLTRNFGVSKAAPGSKYLVFLSQDAAPLPGWLEGLIGLMEADTAMAGVFSRQVPRDGGNPVLRRYMIEEWGQCGGLVKITKEIKDSDDYERRKSWYTAFSNTSSAVRREVFEKFPFRAVEFAEDRLWAADVLEAGCKIVYEPASMVIHSHDYSLVEQFRQNFDDAGSGAAGVSGYAERRNPFLRLPVKLARDAVYVWKTVRPLPERIGWVLYIPLWHAAIMLGRLLGMMKPILPGILIRALSRQARIKHEDTLHV